MPATALVEDLMDNFPYPPLPPVLRVVSSSPDPVNRRTAKSKGVSITADSLRDLERLLETVEQRYGARINGSAAVRLALNVASRELARVANAVDGVTNEYIESLTPERRRAELVRDVERSQLSHGRHRREVDR